MSHYPDYDVAERIMEVVCCVAVSKGDERFASKAEVADLLRQVSAIGKDSRETKTAIQSLTNRSQDISDRVVHKTGHAAFYSGLAGVLALSVAIFIFLLSYYVPEKVKSELSTTNDRIAKTDVRIGKIETKLDMLLNGILKQPTIGNAAEVKTKLIVSKGLLQEARRQDVVIDPGSISEGGATLIHNVSTLGAELRPIAWDTAEEYANYNSFLNAKFNKTPRHGRPASFELSAGMILDHGIVDGLTQELDNRQFLHSTFYNATVIYNGGPLTLEDVEFLNCRFEILEREEGRVFAELLLKSRVVTVHLPAINQ